MVQKVAKFELFEENLTEGKINVDWEVIYFSLSE
jgi:hypothetical protein